MKEIGISYRKSLLFFFTKAILQISVMAIILNWNLWEYQEIIEQGVSNRYPKDKSKILWANSRIIIQFYDVLFDKSISALKNLYWSKSFMKRYFKSHDPQGWMKLNINSVHEHWEYIIKRIVDISNAFIKYYFTVERGIYFLMLISENIDI